MQGIAAPLVLASDEDKIIILLALVTAGVLVYTIGSVRKVLETRYREQTRREVAAYVAEGTIKPEDAARLLEAPSDDVRRKIADGVAWGTIKPEKAESLLRSLRPDGTSPPQAPA